jgi:flagellar M-ring protein FliF
LTQGEGMNEKLGQIRNQGVTVWQALDIRKRIAVVAVSVIVFAGLLYLAASTGRQDFVPLYTGLTTADAYEIIELLKSEGIDYQLADDAQTILVPSSQKHELRLQLASQGLPQGGGSGFELFDSQGFGITEFTQKVNYRRALEGELARTFAAFEQVEYAKVMLAIPEQTLYSDKEQPVTASISLKLKSGRSLSEAQIEGIVHLASAAVEGLTPANVTVVDTAGNILWVEDASEASIQNRLSVTQLQAKEYYETTLQRSIESMLERVVGVGNVAIRVNAVINFDQEESDSYVLEPVMGGSGAIISEQLYSEEVRQGSTLAQGVPGTASNIDTDVPIYQAADADGGSSSVRSEEIRNYEYSRTTTRVKRGYGRVERLSVSALIHPAGLSEDDVERVRDIIAAAAGIDPTRGDEVVVHTMAFKPRLTDEELNAMAIEAERESNREAIRQYIKIGAPIVLGLIAFIFGLVVVRTMRRRVYSGPSPEELLSQLQAATSSEVSQGGEVAEIDSEEVSAEDRRLDQIRQQLEKMARENPQEMAKLIRGWLTEE